MIGLQLFNSRVDTIPASVIATRFGIWMLHTTLAENEEDFINQGGYSEAHWRSTREKLGHTLQLIDGRMFVPRRGRNEDRSSGVELVRYDDPSLHERSANATFLSKWIAYALWARFILAVLAMLPFVITHAITGAVLGIWPTLLCCWCQCCRWCLTMPYSERHGLSRSAIPHPRRCGDGRCDGHNNGAA